MMDYLISQLPGLGVGGVVTYLVPILVRKAKAAWDSFRAAK
jgi:hypothetical protein